MNKSLMNQILVATLATIVAGVALDYIRGGEVVQDTPPPGNSNSSWYTGLIGMGG